MPSQVLEQMRMCSGIEAGEEYLATQLGSIGSRFECLITARAEFPWFEVIDPYQDKYPCSCKRRPKWRMIWVCCSVSNNVEVELLSVAMIVRLRAF